MHKLRTGHSWRAWFEQAWQAQALQRGWVARALWPLSWLLGRLVQKRQVAIRQAQGPQRLPVPVLVVGNVVVGGAGKTPAVLAIVEHLLRRGWTPGVLSRGHGRTGEGCDEVSAGGQADQLGDEPLLIHRRCAVPVFVGRHRFTAGRALLAAHPDVDILVCDDGWQHLALHRDLSVLVFDERGLGNGWLLPAGLLREPWPPGPKAPIPDWVLLQHRLDQPLPTLPMPPHLPVFEAWRYLSDEAYALAQPQRRQRLVSLTSPDLTAIAGVARPQIFFDMLAAAGLHVAHAWALADHASPDALREAVIQAPGLVVCTEKDAVKMLSWSADLIDKVWVVPLTLDVTPAFWSALDQRLQVLRLGARKPFGKAQGGDLETG